MKVPKQAYTIEFKELAVKRIEDGQRGSMVCKKLGLNASVDQRRAQPSTAHGALVAEPGTFLTEPTS